MADEKTDDKANEYFKIFSKTRGERHDIYLADDIADDSADYTDLIHFLSDKVSPDDIIQLHLANLGGSTHSGVMLAHAIKRCQATVLISVEAPCYSMGAIIALTGDALTMRPGTFLMFHNYSGGFYGKGREIVDLVTTFNVHIVDSLKHFCYPFLSKKEINVLAKDQDVYVMSTEEKLIDRLKRHFKKMQL